ncbi:restriction endonuclease [Embleya scabrispora]|uniref:Restriction endonuclease n=1 Tax=Embleya scabrispora TaxID=159449 RepID=A0A1T3NWY0_9ACTN|nr:Uma2 family endonuclease [Embleya scabrispora]OPC81369.1 restriction endonuclease [Embleya scabrispora]
MTQALPEWFYPGPEDGWTAEDLDRLPPEAPRRIELIHGALIVMSPQSLFHMRVLNRLNAALEAQAPTTLFVAREMTIRLGRRSRPEPDMTVVDAAAARNPELTAFEPADVRLVVEVVSPESEERDRTVKPTLYAKSGIAHYWRIEKDMGVAVVYVYELDPTTTAYVPTGVHRGVMKLDVPFPLVLDVGALTR